MTESATPNIVHITCDDECEEEEDEDEPAFMYESLDVGAAGNACHYQDKLNHHMHMNNNNDLNCSHLTCPSWDEDEEDEEEVSVTHTQSLTQRTGLENSMISVHTNDGDGVCRY